MMNFYVFIFTSLFSNSFHSKSTGCCEPVIFCSFPHEIP